MYTAEEVRAIAFTKSFGGYKTTEVDDFVDECADTIESMTKENAELTKKLEILANKLLEYRNEEDTIRTTLLSAQRTGDTVIREAQQKAELILQDANIRAEKVVEDIKAKIVAEQAEYDKLKQEIADFKASILDLYRQHLTQVSLLPETEEEEPAVAEEEPAEAATEPTAEVPAEEVAEEATETESEEAPTDRFADLQFGEGYDVVKNKGPFGNR